MIEADIRAVIGASGTGKTTFIKKKLLKPAPRRLMIWSHKPDYLDYGPHLESLPEALAMLKAKTFRVNFRPVWDDKHLDAQFRLFCRAAMAAGNLTLLIEELHMVTQASYAPPAWREVSCMGRAYGIKVIGTSQRPAHMDKDFLANASDVYGFRVNERNAQRTLADALGVPLPDVKELPNYKYFHRDNTTGTVKTG